MTHVKVAFGAGGKDVETHVVVGFGDSFSKSAATTNASVDDGLNGDPLCGGTGAAWKSAGNVTISASGKPDVVVPHDERVPYTGYGPRMDRGAQWAEGDVLSVRGAGGELPSFFASVEFPTDLTITEPAGFVDDATIPVAVGPLTLAWTPGVGDVIATIGGIATTFPAAAGHGTIPATAIEAARTSAGGAPSTALLLVDSQSLAFVDAGEYRVAVRARVERRVTLQIR
ncbi:MAG TPA: hypothetical protein VLT33_24370 [Labilithrix sp.]|nr:hypothetical protein [Labilithrix sp.]